MLDRTVIPEVKEFGLLSAPVPEYITLSNGIRLAILDQGEQEVNRLTISWSGGTADVDSPAALIVAAELIKEGCKSLTGEEIAEALDFNGAWLRISPSHHFTVLTLHSLNSRFKNVLPIIGEIISSPAFPQEEFEIIKEKVARSRELEAKKVTFHASEADRRLVFGENHPMSRTTTPDDIRRVTIDDINRVYKQVFRSYPPVTFIAGRITDEIRHDTISVLESLTFDNNNDRHITTVPLSPSTVRSMIIDRPESLQTAVKLSIPAISRSDADYNDLRLATMALGGYFGSRLMSNIREDKGYTYGISAGLLGYPEGGVITIDSQCDNTYTNLLIDETINEINRLKSDPMDSDELSHVRRYAMTSLAATLDSPFSIMDYYINLRHYAMPADYFMKQQTAIRELSADTIMKMARKYYNLDNLYTSVAGSIDNINKQQ